MIDQPVRIAYENINPDPFWNQTDHLPYWYTIITPDGKRKIIVIHDAIHNVFAFEVTRHYPMEFIGNVGSWDRKDALPKTQLIKWIKNNA